MSTSSKGVFGMTTVGTFTNKLMHSILKVLGIVQVAIFVFLVWTSITTDASADEFPSPETLSFVERGETVSSQSVRNFVRELNWLAIVIYFESRDQSYQDQLRVAKVVLNRVDDPRYPGTIKEVVSQDKHIRNRCQFSFMCDGNGNTDAAIRSRVKNMRAWETAIKAAVETYRQWQSGDSLGCSLFYRASYVSNKKILAWFDTLHKEGQFGTHIFYCDSKKKV